MRTLSWLMLAICLVTLNVSCKPTRAQDQGDQGTKGPAGEYLVAWEAHAVDDKLESTITLRSVIIEQRADESSRVVASKVGQAILGAQDHVWVMKIVEGSTSGIGCPSCDPSDDACFESWREEAEESPLAIFSLELTPLTPESKAAKHRLAESPSARHQGTHMERIIPVSQVGSRLFVESMSETFYCYTDGSAPEVSRQEIDLQSQQPSALLTEQDHKRLEQEFMGQAMAMGKAQYGEDFEEDQVKLKLSTVQLIYTAADKLKARYLFEGECGTCGAMVDEPEAVSFAVDSEQLPGGITPPAIPPAIVEYWRGAPHKEKVMGRGWSKLTLNSATLEKVMASFK